MKRIWGADVKKWEKMGEERVIGSARGLELYIQDFVNPGSGKVDEYSIIRKKEGVTVCPVTEKGNLVLVREFKHGAGEIFFLFPAGFHDHSRGSILKSAHLELRQETGYVSKEMELIGEEYPMPGKSSIKESLVIALGCHKTWTQDLDETEDAIDVFEVEVQEFWEMAERGTSPIASFTKLAALKAALLGHIPFKK